MKAYAVLGRTSVFLAFPATLLTLLLYLYPLFLGCSFPEATRSSSAERVFDGNGSRNGSTLLGRAPFRLLALGDPQLEGDSSIAKPGDPLFKSLDIVRYITRTSDISTDVEALAEIAKLLFTRDIPRLLWSYRKRLDLFGNDYYLAHIYRTLHWWLEPTHTTVLGDLIGSQWVNDDEFERRGWRFWNTVFRRGRRVEDSITNAGSTVVLGEDPIWSERVINIAGNHDIGYAGDLDRRRLERFESMFGKTSWDIKFQLPKPNTAAPIPELRIVVLNNMNLDSPVYAPDIQKGIYDFINEQIIYSSRPVEDRTTGTILLTHIPLHKEDGVCMDGPSFQYGQLGIRSQNHLSPSASKSILEGIFGISGKPNSPANGFGRNGVIMTGHDHEGCDVHHYILPETDHQASEWKASRWKHQNKVETGEATRGIREITVRSMMGDFGGNAGLLSAWFDDEFGEWRFEYATCPLGVQHIWWAIHVLDLITLLCGVAASLLFLHKRFLILVFQPPKLSQWPYPRKQLTGSHLNGSAVTPRNHNSRRAKKQGNKGREGIK